MPAVTPAVRAFSTFSLSDSSFTLLLTVSKLRVNWWVSWVGAVAGSGSQHSMCRQNRALQSAESNRLNFGLMRPERNGQLKTCLKKDFPGSPLFKTPHFHCRKSGFHPWLGN